MSIYNTYKPTSGGDLYLKLKDGDSVKLRIASEPVIFTNDFDGKITERFAWVVYNRNDKKAQVYAAGKSVYGQLADLVEEWGEPTEYDITIKRSGEGLETKYGVVPSPTSLDLTGDEKKAVDEVDLLKATGGRWLQDFAKDGKLPDPKVKSESTTTTSEVPVEAYADVSDEEINLDDIPF
jgi:hypothetical protein